LGKAFPKRPARWGPAMTDANGASDTLAAATAYLARDWRSIPVPFGGKKPVMPAWPLQRFDAAALARVFNGKPKNLGVLLGEPSGGLTDVDLDVSEAVELAPAFLPPTSSIFGRASRPASHLEYICDPTVSTKQYEDIDGTMLMELRSTGAQTLFPPSVADDEARVWDEEGEPANVAGPGAGRPGVATCGGDAAGAPLAAPGQSAQG
jgi:Bifunctional DNA primase/polymerase, N-terminal